MTTFVQVVDDWREQTEGRVWWHMRQARIAKRAADWARMRRHVAEARRLNQRLRRYWRV